MICRSSSKLLCLAYALPQDKRHRRRVKKGAKTYSLPHGKKTPKKERCITRSRPYHKDDNAHVEQKNWMWPRQLLGYGRLEDQRLLSPINALYTQAWGPLHNFFLPSMKLVKKWREGSRWVRRHDEPQTAYQRLLAHGDLQPKARRQLRDQYEALDPFVLAAQVERRLKPILGAALAE